jgi:CRP/FNR family cyclic AMP-dependent transcriptional regulator
MAESGKTRFDVSAFLANAGIGRTIVQLKRKQPLFSQGDLANSVFYLQMGPAKVTVVSATGKEATIMLLSKGEFVGGVDGGGPGAAFDNSHGRYRLYCTQDNEG